MAKSLLEDFGIRKPKIAILALNPHAGDRGAIGKEELNVIIPSINKLKAEHYLVFGPFPADGFLARNRIKILTAFLLCTMTKVLLLLRHLLLVTE